jgi:hypothetical protein
MSRVRAVDSTDVMIETPVRSSFAPATRAACNGVFASSTRAGSTSAERWRTGSEDAGHRNDEAHHCRNAQHALALGPHRQMLRYLFHDRRAAAFSAHAANVRAVTVALRQRVALIAAPAFLHDDPRYLIARRCRCLAVLRLLLLLLHEFCQAQWSGRTAGDDQHELDRRCARHE